MLTQGPNRDPVPSLKFLGVHISYNHMFDCDGIWIKMRHFKQKNYFLLKNQNWVSPTCDSFYLIMSHISTSWSSKLSCLLDKLIETYLQHQFATFNILNHETWRTKPELQMSSLFLSDFHYNSRCCCKEMLPTTGWNLEISICTIWKIRKVVSQENSWNI